MKLSAWELIAVLAIILLLFGAKKLPDLAASMGRSIREFRRAHAEEDDEAAVAEVTSKRAPKA